jgi:hypothetical protein
MNLFNFSKTPLCALLFSLYFCSISSAQNLKDLFRPHKAWKFANEVKAEGTFIKATTKGNEIYFNQHMGELHSKGKYSAVSFKMDFTLHAIPTKEI